MIRNLYSIMNTMKKPALNAGHLVLCNNCFNFFFFYKLNMVGHGISPYKLFKYIYSWRNL